jgi:biopolymer transport protein ExbD
MAVAGGASLRSEINVTPLVDVVLVLLIIFMVVIPMLQTGHPVSTPPESGIRGVVPPSAAQLIVRMEKGPRYFLGRDEMPLARFAARLEEVTRTRGSRMVFLAADGELPYGEVAQFMDLCRNHGASSLGVVFEDLHAGG